jgi:hypothetical protein
MMPERAASVNLSSLFGWIIICLATRWAVAAPASRGPKDFGHEKHEKARKAAVLILPEGPLLTRPEILLALRAEG